LLSLGDKLESERFYVLVSGLKRLTFKKKGGNTGRHKSQITNTNNYTYAEIQKSFTHIQNAIDKKLLSNKK